MIYGKTMNEIYRRVAFDLLHDSDRCGTTRKGEKLYEKFSYAFTLTNPLECFATLRGMSMEYLKKEFAFYCSGSNSVHEAAKMSKFWLKCTDDGETINSNYGKLLFHDRNEKGFTQFEHAVNSLKNNKDSKKAVMAIYTSENAYISNDNPCTMFLHLYIANDALHMSAFMRSNDIWFGTVYDVPFFCAVLNAALVMLRITYPTLKLGTYMHMACNMHAYERNAVELQNIADGTKVAPEMNTLEAFRYVLFMQVLAAAEKTCAYEKRAPISTERQMSAGLKAAWECSKQSNCLKKKCGAALVHDGNVIAVGFGGREGEACTVCARDNGEVFYSDGCYSVHAEMRAVMQAVHTIVMPDTQEFFSQCTMYTTHGPCDACMKLMDYVGIRHVVYDVEYKTDYSHYPRIRVEREAYTPESVEAGKHA